MRLLAMLAAAFAAWAQAPVHVQFQCTAEDIQSMRQNCSNTEPCPVYLELAALDVVGSKVFVAGNLHAEASTIASILLASADGGKTWTEPHQRIPNSGLDQIQFFDFEVGWISGHTLLGTPKDPFLLVTRDGGKSWSAKPIFDESRAGTIEQFSFDSRTSGALVIDRVQASETGVRYELYESMTGGESWMMRQAGASPIRLKRGQPASSNTDWRLRADAGSKTYRVERQDSGKWVAMATFPVRIGECREPEAALPDTPAVDAEKAQPEAVKQDAPPARPTRIPSLKKKPQFDLRGVS